MAFPNGHYAPAELAQSPCLPSVTNNILGKLFDPERFTSFRGARFDARWMAMPKATMHKNGTVGLGHDDVWRSRKRLRVQPVRCAEIAQQPTHLEFGSGMLLAHTRHQCTSCRIDKVGLCFLGRPATTFDARSFLHRLSFLLEVFPTPKSLCAL